MGKSAFNYDLEEEDKRKLKGGQYDLLNKSAREFYHIFDDGITEYFSLLHSLSNDQINKLFPVN